MNFDEFLASMGLDENDRANNDLWIEELGDEILTLNSVTHPASKEILRVIVHTETYLKSLPNIDRSMIQHIISAASEQCHVYLRVAAFHSK